MFTKTWLGRKVGLFSEMLKKCILAFLYFISGKKFKVLEPGGRVSVNKTFLALLDI